MTSEDLIKKGLRGYRIYLNGSLKKLEDLELEDIEELKKIRHEPTRPLAEVLRELKLDGKL